MPMAPAAKAHRHANSATINIGEEVTRVRPLRETSPAFISVFLNVCGLREAEEDGLRTEFDVECVADLLLHEIFESQQFRAGSSAAIDEGESMFRRNGDASESK